MAPTSDSDSSENDGGVNADASQEASSSNEEGPRENCSDKLGDDHPESREIRLAKVTVTRTGHGVTMDLIAGKLRLRLYIEAQWATLIQKIVEGEGELNQLVPFRMAPLAVEEDTDHLTPDTLDARRIPELSSENPLYGTPLWDAIFPSGEPPAEDSGRDRRGEASERSSEEDST